MNISRKKACQTEYFDPARPDASRLISSKISNLIHHDKHNINDIVVLCIGTDRATGDALGPITGSILSETCDNCNVYGTLKKPVHALNLRENIRNIYATHESPTVIAIDASLGHSSDVGLITLSNTPLYPGIGVNKKLPAIGDISITGIVNLSGKPGLSLLQSTRLYTVSTMATCIARALVNVIG